MKNKKEASQRNSEGSLFRKEVLEKKQTQNLGKAIIITPISFLFWSGGIFVFAIALGLFLYFGKYTRRQEVHGMLMPNKGLINIYAEKPGVITKKFVQQGSYIKKNNYFILYPQSNIL